MSAALGVMMGTEDGAFMAVEHDRLSVAAVQFCPELIMTPKRDAGRRLILNDVGGVGRTDVPFLAQSDAV